MKNTWVHPPYSLPPALHSWHCLLGDRPALAIQKSVRPKGSVFVLLSVMHAPLRCELNFKQKKSHKSHKSWICKEFVCAHCTHAKWIQIQPWGKGFRSVWKDTNAGNNFGILPGEADIKSWQIVIVGNPDLKMLSFLPSQPNASLPAMKQGGSLCRATRRIQHKVQWGSLG